MPLPNLERHDALIGSMKTAPSPSAWGASGGVGSRASSTRAPTTRSGSKRWRPSSLPDFDARYYQSAPVDQQFPLFKGGELIRCTHMAEEPLVEYRMPSLEVPVSFGFVDRVEERRAVLDTVILEPHLKVAMLLWRASVPLGKKLNALRAICVGEQPRRPAPAEEGPEERQAALRGHRGHHRVAACARVGRLEVVSRELGDEACRSPGGGDDVSRGIAVGPRLLRPCGPESTGWECCRTATTTGEKLIGSRVTFITADATAETRWLTLLACALKDATAAQPNGILR